MTRLQDAIHSRRRRSQDPAPLANQARVRRRTRLLLITRSEKNHHHPWRKPLPRYIHHLRRPTPRSFPPPYTSNRKRPNNLHQQPFNLQLPVHERHDRCAQSHNPNAPQRHQQRPTDRPRHAPPTRHRHNLLSSPAGTSIREPSSTPS
jgi:hypothetical protein